jgi:ribulose-5-phosphate 4-epimerase/fuculose-1-phosphate aldolase
MNDQEVIRLLQIQKDLLLKEKIATASTVCISLRSKDQAWILTAGNNDDNVSSIRLDDAPPSAPNENHTALHHAVYKRYSGFNAIIHSDQVNILTAARAGKPIPPLLDDFVQLVGPDAKAAASSDVGSVLSGLKRRNAVLLKDEGALCAAADIDDARAVAHVMEKGCRAFIETFFLGGGVPINWLEARLMRLVYQYKYSRITRRV